MADPGHAAGNQTYPPVAPDCTCSHAEVMHELYAGRRRKCHTGTKQGPCDCGAYYPREGSDG